MPIRVPIHLISFTDLVEWETKEIFGVGSTLDRPGLHPINPLSLIPNVIDVEIKSMDCGDRISVSCLSTITAIVTNSTHS